MARALHSDACRDHALVAWIVLWDLPAYPERFAARLATTGSSPYLLLADTLAGIRELLPPDWCGQSGNRLTRRRWWRFGLRGNS